MRRTIRRLTLGRETIRRLSTQHLQWVAGAASPGTLADTCNCTDTCGTCFTHCYQGSCAAGCQLSNARGC
jgi:hypothetical protein